MNTRLSSKIRTVLSSLLLFGAGISMIGCADEYAGYPGYGRGYYASYPGYRPYYYGTGYGYVPYRSYGPYYGSSYYGAPYYGGGATVVVSRDRAYSRTNAYRHQQNRTVRARTSNVRTNNVTRPVKKTQRPDYQNDDESRYYPAR
ncbi:MAG: hypothetical protein QOG67_2803 [Verrucomicrobiota bacterium]|jgi:hypothetical protein